MLKSKSVAKLIEEQLNQIDNSEKFRVDYEFGGYQGTEINCILKQGDGTVAPVLNYTNVRTSFNIEVILPTQCGEDRIDNIISIFNTAIESINGKINNIDEGKAIFLFNPIKINSLETRASAGQSIILNLSFSAIYSNNNNGNKYELALINTQFEYGTQNVRRFNSKDEQILWFLDKIDNAPFYEILTPSLTNLEITQQYLNPRKIPLNELAVNNYAIIKETKWNQEENYYFYYITSCNIDNYNVLSVNLKLDTIQTYYIDLEFGDCFISKAHLNRWLEYGNNRVQFDILENSPLFEREDFKGGDKILIKRDVVSPLQTHYKTLDDWYARNILGWIYVFIQGGHTYNIGAVSSESGNQKFIFPRFSYKSYVDKDSDRSGGMYNTMPCFAVPVYKGEGGIIKIHANNGPYGAETISLGAFSIDEFIALNSADFIYSMKFSIVPPFKISSLTNSDWTIDEKDNLILAGTIQDLVYGHTVNDKSQIYAIDGFWGEEGNWWNGFAVRWSGGTAFLYIAVQHNVQIDIMYKLDLQMIFNKSEIVGSDRNIKYNPKLYSSDYMSVKISDNSQNGAEYDILKLGASDSINLLYTEALTPDISKIYLRAIGAGANKGIYNIYTTQNLTGFVNSDDRSLILESDAYRAMLANNKNFFLQNSTNRNYDLGQSAFNSVSSALQGYFLSGSSMVGAATSAGVSLVNAGLNYEKSKINENFTVDNLKNAPNSVKGAMGNAVFNCMYSDTGIVVEIYDVLPFEKQIIDDQMYLYGYNFNKIANIKDYDNIRHYFNFVQANVDNIKGEISNPIRDDIRQRFSEGVRFWNTDDIDYKKENYERWLEA